MSGLPTNQDLGKSVSLSGKALPRLTGTARGRTVRGTGCVVRSSPPGSDADCKCHQLVAHPAALAYFELWKLPFEVGVPPLAATANRRNCATLSNS